jgi:hypothetical protein
VNIYGFRGRITTIMKSVLGNCKKRYPDERVINVQEFQLTILPKPKQQSKIPKHLVKNFGGFYVYPICIKITSLNPRNQSVIDLTAGPSRPPNLNPPSSMQQAAPSQNIMATPRQPLRPQRYAQPQHRLPPQRYTQPYRTTHQFIPRQVAPVVRAPRPTQRTPRNKTSTVIEIE